jgi:hypothetical protein
MATLTTHLRATATAQNRLVSIVKGDTRQETAKALGVSPIMVDRLVARGLRRPLFPLSEIERFLKETSAE